MPETKKADKIKNPQNKPDPEQAEREKAIREDLIARGVICPEGTDRTAFNTYFQSLRQ